MLIPRPPALLVPENVRRVLVIRRKALGDAVVTLPAVVGLAAALPAARVDLVVDRHFASLLDCATGGVRVLSWPPPPGSGRGWIAWLRRQRYDLVIDFLGSPRTALWTALTGAPLRVGYGLRGRAWAYNVRVPRNRTGVTTLREFAGEGFLDPLRELGLCPAPWQPVSRLRTPPQALGGEYVSWREQWQKLPGRRIGIMLSASWPAKAWPAREGAALYRHAAAAGCAVVLIAGPGDEALSRELLEAVPEAHFAPPTGLHELADLLGRLDLLVSTDCGPRHLAATFNTPTLTLFGPTDPAGWNQHHPDHVALRRGVSCSPCDLTVCPVPGHPCLDGLHAEAVWEKAQVILARRTREESP